MLGVPMDVDIDQCISIETLEQELLSMTLIDGAERNIFTAQDSMDTIEIENGILNIQIPSIDGISDLLYSEDIYSSEKELGIKMPVDELVEIKNRTVVLIGVSGCGKTRSCYDLCRHRWCLYFDCSIDDDFIYMLDQLENCRPSEKSEQSQQTFENHSKRLIKCLIGARLFVLKSLRDINTNLTSFDWLCTQRSRRTRLLFYRIFKKLSNSNGSLSSALYEKLKDILQKEGHIIFDESQTLLEKLKFDYRSSKDFQKAITRGVFENPRSFFSFLTGTIIQSGLRSIWCGTHMKIRSMELIHSSAGGKSDGIFVFTNFNYLTATNIAQLLSKWLKLDTHTDPIFIESASHILQGRPRFLISFLHRLRNISDHSRLVTILNSYCSLMTTQIGKEDFDSSLYSFWYQRIQFDIVPIEYTGTGLHEKKLIKDILIKLCISWLFGDGESIMYFPHLDMVSTGLVMVKNEGDNWTAIMAEPLSLTAGLNYLADQDSDVLMDYFANQLFVPMGSPNLTPQERGNMMELVITLRFMMSWWKDPSVKQYLPQWLEDYTIPKPRGVLDGRGGTDSHIIFIQQLRNPSFPWIVLPHTNAGPDIRYSVFSCCVKTTWTKNSETTMFVSPEECRKNIKSTDPTCWYSSQRNINREVQDSLSYLVHIRFELPYTAPLFANGKEGVSDSSLEGNYSKLFIDLNSDLAVPFFGAKFVEKYLKFVKEVLR